MILKIHSDGSYLSKSKARSQCGGHFFLGNKTVCHNNNNNGAVLTNAKMLRNVVASAAEAEYGCLFKNAHLGLPLWNVLIVMGHPQPPTPVLIDNTTAEGLANKKIKQTVSKAIDMRYHWIRDRIKQNQFHVYWGPGTENKAGYFSKHHTVKQQKSVRNTYLRQHNALAQGCANLQNIPRVIHEYSTCVNDSKVSTKILPTHMHVEIRHQSKYTSAQLHKFNTHA